MRSLGRLVSQGEEHPYERRAVTDAMVNTPEEDAAVPKAFDESEPPQGPVQVQGNGEKLRHGTVERFHIPRRRENNAPNVRAQVELRIGLPKGTRSERASFRDHALAKALVDQ